MKTSVSLDISLAKGLSIAVIVLTGLALLGYLVAVIALAVGVNLSTDPGAVAMVLNQFYANPEFGGALPILSADDVTTVIGGGFSIAIGAALVGLALKVVILVAAILAYRNAEIFTKLNVPFVLSIVGAVFAFATGGVVSGVLLIVLAITLYRLRYESTTLEVGAAI